MRNRFFLPLLFILTSLILSACGGGGGGSTNANTASGGGGGGSTTSSNSSGGGSSFTPTVLTADATSTNNVGISAQNASASSSSTVDSKIATGDLIKINSSGNIERIFNYSFPIYDIKTTTNYLIVSGIFISPLDAAGNPLIVDGNGNAIKCYLYAIKKTAAKKNGDITCLSANQVGSYDPLLAASNAHYAHLGFDTINTSVYFTDWANGILYKWTEGGASPSPIFTQPPPSNSGVGMDDVYLDHSGSGNLCVLYSALSYGTNIYYGNIYCGTDTGLVNTVQGTSSGSVLAETRGLGKYLVTSSQKIDMTTLALSSRTANGSNGGLPSGSGNIAATSSGSTIQRAYAWSLSYMDTSGNTCLIATTNGLTNSGCSTTAATVSSYFQTVYGLGNYVWAYGSSDPNDPTTGNYLAKINSSTYALDSTNYLSATGLISISSLTINTDGTLIVAGKNSNGNSAYAYIDTNGLIAPSSNSPVISFTFIKRVSY